jgi:phage-related protein
MDVGRTISNIVYCRVVYVAEYIEAIYVLHAFEKRTQRTRQGDIELARSRVRLVERSRLSQ